MQYPGSLYGFGSVKLLVEIGIQAVSLVGHERAERPVRSRYTAITPVQVLTAGDRRRDSLLGIGGNARLHHSSILPIASRSPIAQSALPQTILVVHECQNGLLHVLIVRRAERLDEYLTSPFQPNRRRDRDISFERSQQPLCEWSSSNGARERNIRHAKVQRLKPAKGMRRQVGKPAESQGSRHES